MKVVFLTLMAAALSLPLLLWNARRKAKKLEPVEDRLVGEEAHADWTLRWSEVEEVVEVYGYHGTQYRAIRELQTLASIEVVAAGPGPAFRLAKLPEPLRSLARNLDGEDVVVGDDRVRITWKEGTRAVLHDRPRALLLFTLLQTKPANLLSKINGLAEEAARIPLLTPALEFLSALPGIEALAERVRTDDPTALRLLAALALQHPREALELAADPEVGDALALQAVDRFGATHAEAADRVLARLVGKGGTAGLARVRALPLERAVALLKPWARNPDTADALALLTELAPDVALPELLALIRAESPTTRLGAARLLHGLDHVLAEDTLLALIEETDWSERDQAITELGRLGSERAVAPLRALLKAGFSTEDLLAEDSLAELRARLAGRPVGGLALTGAGSEGGLSMAPGRGGLGLAEEEPL